VWIQRLVVWAILGLLALSPDAGAAPAGPPSAASDAGIVTIVEGDARVLRGTTWQNLVPGAHVQESDLFDVGDGAHIQVELPRGGALSLFGPASTYLAGTPATGGKDGAASDWTLTSGWVKVAATGGGTPIRLRTSAAVVDVADGIIVAAVQPPARLFVESGSARVVLPVAKGREAPARELRAGEYWVRDGDAAPRVAARVAQDFVASMPRPLLDPLPLLAARHAGAGPTLRPAGEADFDDVETWLTGPHRRAFVRRFTPRLADPAFRAEVEKNIVRFPEWDRVLHPEKYSTEKPPAPR
jgi:hypothetical protein